MTPTARSQPAAIFLGIFRNRHTHLYDLGFCRTTITALRNKHPGIISDTEEVTGVQSQYRAPRMSCGNITFAQFSRRFQDVCHVQDGPDGLRWTRVEPEVAGTGKVLERTSWDRKDHNDQARRGVRGAWSFTLPRWGGPCSLARPPCGASPRRQFQPGVRPGTSPTIDLILSTIACGVETS